MVHNFTKVLLLLLLSLAGTVNAQQWEALHTGVTEDLYDVCCIDANTIFVCGQNGVILKSTNSGGSWVEKYRRMGCQMTEICFADENNGYAVCDSTLDDYSHQWFLVKTCDGGETWNDIGNPVFSWVESYTLRQFVRVEMFLNDADNLVVAVSFDGIYRSTDGGLTMRRLENDFTINETRGVFFEDNVGYLLWDNGEEDFMFPGERYPGVAKTEDYGETWVMRENVADITAGITYAHFYDKNHIRLFGEFQISEYDYYNILDTYDGFGSFETIDGGIYGYMQCIEEYIRAKFTENGCGVAMAWEEDMPGVGRDVSYTEDDGLTWTSYLGLPFCRFYDIDGVDTTFFISCEYGKVLKNRQLTFMDIQEDALSITTVYPNPVGNMLVIETENAQKIEIFDNVGKTVVERPFCQNHITIDCSKLTPGVYVIVVTDTEGKRRSRKIIK